MSFANDAGDDLVAEYLLTYIEWRERYGLEDACMEELLAAVLVESERTQLPSQVQKALQSLAHIIEAELHAVQERAA